MKKTFKQYPETETTIIGNETRVSTSVRIKREGVWYDIPAVFGFSGISVDESMIKDRVDYMKDNWEIGKKGSRNYIEPSENQEDDL